jgi:hypothetical protein
MGWPPLPSARAPSRVNPMTGATLAHAAGVFLLAAGFVANERRRLVLAKLLVVCGIAVGHLPDLVAATGAP